VGQIISELWGREETNKASDSINKFLFDLKSRTFMWGKWRLESSCAVSEVEEMLVALNSSHLTNS